MKTTYIYTKKRNNISLLVNCAEELVCVLSPTIIAVDSEAAVISAINKVFPDAVITGCNFHFNQCLWREAQDISLTVEYKEDEHVPVPRKMCAALAHLPVDEVEQGWLTITEMFRRIRD
jgi:hypothetical protein